MCVSLLMLFKNFLQDIKLHLNVTQLFSDSQEQDLGAACQRNAIHPFPKECHKYSKYPWTRSGGNKEWESYGEQVLVLNQQILRSAGRARTLYSPNAVNLTTELKYIQRGKSVFCWQQHINSELTISIPWVQIYKQYTDNVSLFCYQTSFFGFIWILKSWTPSKTMVHKSWST